MISAGTSQAMIFSKIVLLIDCSVDAAFRRPVGGLESRVRESLHDHQRAIPDAPLGGQALAEILDNLVVEFLTTTGPAAGPRQLLDAASQTGEANHMGRLDELLAQFVTKPREEGELKALAGLASQLAQVGFQDASRHWGRG